MRHCVKLKVCLSECEKQEHVRQCIISGFFPQLSEGPSSPLPLYLNLSFRNTSRDAWRSSSFLPTKYMRWGK